MIVIMKLSKLIYFHMVVICAAGCSVNSRNSYNCFKEIKSIQQERLYFQSALASRISWEPLDSQKRPIKLNDFRVHHLVCYIKIKDVDGYFFYKLKDSRNLKILMME